MDGTRAEKMCYIVLVVSRFDVDAATYKLQGPPRHSGG